MIGNPPPHQHCNGRPLYAAPASRLETPLHAGAGVGAGQQTRKSLARLTRLKVPTRKRCAAVEISSRYCRARDEIGFRAHPISRIEGLAPKCQSEPGPLCSQQLTGRSLYLRKLRTLVRSKARLDRIRFLAQLLRFLEDCLDPTASIHTSIIASIC